MTGSGAHQSHYETRQRRAVLHALTQASGFVSAQALHAQLRRNGHAIALSTVYRALRIYADDGRIDITHDPAGVQLFHGRPIPGHGHYLTCRACGDSIPINADVVEKWVAATAARHGFVDSHSIIELTGLCPACNLRTGSS